MYKLVEKYVELPAAIRRPMWQIWHKLIIRFDQDQEAVFMNYGYQGLNGDPALSLEAGDEKDRYCIQLYDHVVSGGNIKGKHVLEVGSGRGGGASYIARYYKPESYTGLDISSSVIDFCNQYHKVPNLSFKKGVAEDLPFEDHSFDTLVNVESARCYHSLKKFFSEAHRVLKPDGQFLFADMIKKGEDDSIRKELVDSGFEIASENSIAPNVVEALNRDDERRYKIISKRTPGFLRKAFLEFAGAKGTERYESFANGKIQYWSFILNKKH
jgi:ubiquinone/menaquinone biosynthesis C-methylase UbiE